ncbi:MAG: phospholipid carrier-dependent glycosyltransferase, partial [Chloroflexi bacterium]|nr:phospholipid carrier-dependent glycosyltransferase [Chloroflexota bacterium]
MVAGFALRLIIAYVLFPGSGFESDVGTFTAWSLHLADVGPGQFYETAGFADYPPGYLTVLWIVGMLAGALGPVFGGSEIAAATALVKIPPILADIAVGYLLYRITLRWLRDRPNAHTLALGAAALYLFNPVTWYDSALWGQVDAVGALVVLATIGLLFAGWSEVAAGMAVMAGLVKPQYGIVLAPVVGIVLLRRHLFFPGSGPVPQRVAAGLRGFFVERQGPVRILSSAIAGIVVLFAFLVPYSLDIPGFIELLAKTAGGYPYLSVNAYNPWALVSSGGAESMAAGAPWNASSDTVPFLGPVPAVVVGTFLLAVGFIVGLRRLAQRDDRRTIVLVAAYLSLAFFILPTRVHERYLFPVFAVLPMLAVLDRRWLIATGVLALASFINLHGVLTTPLYATPNVADLPLGEAFRSPLGIIVSIVLHTAVFAFVLWRLRPSAETASAGAFGRPDPDPVAAVLDSADGHGLPDGSVGPGGTAQWRLDRGRRPSALDGFVRRIRGGNVRRDRSAELVGERGGRLDRLDLLLLAVVLLSTLGVRTFRLSEPYGMHFDEVYHARTGAEFLQDWRYGIDHDVYEWTHPHMAKYFMAAGLAIAGNDRVTGTAELAVPVRAAVVEPRWSPDDEPAIRNGDRLYVATGDEIKVYDLRDRTLVATIALDGTALALADGTHQLIVADGSGGLWRLDTTMLDQQRFGVGLGEDPTPESFATLDLPADAITVTADESHVVVRVAGDELRSVDAESGTVDSSVIRAGAAAVVAADQVKRVVIDPAELADPTADATAVAGALDADEATINDKLAAGVPVIVAVAIKSEQESELQKLIDDGLTGVTIESGDTVAVAEETGVAILDDVTLEEVQFVSLTEPARGLAMVRGLDDPALYVATGRQLEVVRLAGDEPATKSNTVKMPNEVRDVYWDEATNQVHALGTTQDGGADTIYVVEPHGNAVYADARLPFPAAAVALDFQPERPSDDRQDILAFSAEGTIATVDAGNHAFAWRLPGVLMGGVLAIAIYLLARILFRRRSVAILASLFALADGMFFANSRIAMNDIYVTTFIVAAFTAFAPLYLGIARRRWAVLLGLPLVGLLLGLALASKWAGAFAIGAIGLAVLLRSALGRLVALAGMVALTAVLGIIGITADPSIEGPRRNYLFLLVMLGLTVALAVLSVVRPVRFTRDELRFAVLGPGLTGAVLLALGVYLAMTGGATPGPGSLLGGRDLPLLGGLGLIALGLAAAASAWLAGRFGIGPLAPAEPDVRGRLLGPSTPAPDGWLRPGTVAGLPWLFALVCIGVLPFLVYIVSYAPWAAMNNNQWGLPLIGSLPFMPRGGTGQTLLDLTKGMYDYHNDLRASHPASSPWWAWPFDMKPVWFYQEGFANKTTGVIYDSGNLVLFWLSVPAVGWTAFQAWRRRSLPLTLVMLAIMCLWLSWARIDRATFQYHVFTTLPFAFLALAYFVAELWHGPSWRTWLLARVAAAVALVAAPLLWLGRGALCTLADVEAVRQGGQACGPVTQEFTVTISTVVSAIVLIVGLVLLIRQLGTFAAQRRAGLDGAIELSPSAARLFGQDTLPGAILPALTLLGTLLALVVATRTGETPIFKGPLGATGPAIVALPALALLAIVAYVALGARDSRRWVVGLGVTAVLWFAIWYPNISGLPLPDAVANNYLMTLPTYNYDFQFAVNTDTPYKKGLPIPDMAIVGVVLAGTVLAAMYATYAWRLELA